MKTTIWLDCDPGHDDAFAILLCDHPALNLLGISTVHGNQTVEKTTQNAIKTIALGAMPLVDVVAGQAKPLVLHGQICPEIHGDSGLDAPNSTFPTTTQKPVAQNAIVHMHKKIMACDTKVTLVATGCLTNVALLLTMFADDVKSKLDKIVILGGSVGIGNITPAAEFNILVDPHAAHIVFESNCCEIYMIPIDVTHTNLVTAARKAHIEQRIGRVSSFSKTIFDLLLFFETTYQNVFAFKDGPPLHDPLAVAFVIDPSLFVFTKKRVDVEISSALCMGRTVVDVYDHSKRVKNVHVIEKADIDGFWRLMIDSLYRASQRRHER